MHANAKWPWYIAYRLSTLCVDVDIVMVVFTWTYEYFSQTGKNGFRDWVLHYCCFVSASPWEIHSLVSMKNSQPTSQQSFISLHNLTNNRQCVNDFLQEKRKKVLTQKSTIANCVFLFTFEVFDQRSNRPSATYERNQTEHKTDVIKSRKQTKRRRKRRGNFVTDVLAAVHWNDACLISGFQPAKHFKLTICVECMW